ncbi:hypothetical protein ACN38_g10620 [Penicillium nordicum]|uniref:Uncharacterized protein n=1 Tax=Penicillium nordicum TaxID=229535 RepID=A0A0M9WBG5_9EURO|nr:hypothetical protein ACN38_g10620 [Penicillium nordicum]
MENPQTAMLKYNVLLIHIPRIRVRQVSAILQPQYSTAFPVEELYEGATGSESSDIFKHRQASVNNYNISFYKVTPSKGLTQTPGVQGVPSRLRCVEQSMDLDYYYMWEKAQEEIVD